MFSPCDASWWWLAGVLLVPVGLAARRKPKREREPPRRPPSPRSAWRLPLLALGLFVATVVVVSALRGGSSREARSPSGAVPGAPVSATSPEALASAMAEQWKAMASTVCPRFAALQRGDAGSPSARAWELANVECLGQICEHPEQLEARSPGAGSRLQPICQALFSVMRKRWELTVSADSVRLACPTALVKWSGQPWSPSNHLSFYREMRGCMERGEGAADLAEALGDAPAAARWRQQIQAAPVLQEQGEGRAPAGACASWPGAGARPVSRGARGTARPWPGSARRSTSLRTCAPTQGRPPRQSLVSSRSGDDQSLNAGQDSRPTPGFLGMEPVGLARGIFSCCWRSHEARSVRRAGARAAGRGGGIPLDDAAAQA